MNRAAGLALALLASGCQDASLEWRFTLGGVAGVETIGAFVRDGDCAGDAERTGYLFARSEESPVLPAPLDGGTYCLEVVAYDAACATIGRGEETVVLPSSEPSVLVTVEPVAGRTDPLCQAHRAARDGGP